MQTQQPMLQKPKTTPAAAAGGHAKIIDDDEVHRLIQERAYQLYLERGAQPGHEIEDWTRAERETLARVASDRSANP
jgi:hypothetical protein